VYTDAASDFGEDPAGTPGDKDVEAGTKPPAAAVGSEKRRTMLVPTDSGLVTPSVILLLLLALALTFTHPLSLTLARTLT